MAGDRNGVWRHCHLSAIRRIKLNYGTIGDIEDVSGGFIQRWLQERGSGSEGSLFALWSSLEVTELLTMFTHYPMHDSLF